MRTAVPISKRRIAALVYAFFVVLASSTQALAAPASLVNPGLEQAANGVPNCFEQAGWGSNTAKWTLTNAAHSGSVAQSLTITNYAGGDRKLLMSESTACAPAVTPGATYKL